MLYRVLSQLETLFGAPPEENRELHELAKVQPRGRATVMVQTKPPKVFETAMTAVKILIAHHARFSMFSTAWPI